MIFKVFDDMSQCCQKEVERLSYCVSKQRYEQAMRYSHLFGQFCCMKSYEMLKDILCEMQNEGNSVGDLEFQYNEYGAPYLQDGPYFSISHCKAGIAVAVSEKPIGIDIEAVRKPNDGLVCKTMNTEEYTSIIADSSPDWAFIRLWTQKEAYLKMKGTGIISDLKLVLTDAQDAEFRSYDNNDLQYVVTIAEKI
jgi:phosphopantetheinyl transferase